MPFIMPIKGINSVDKFELEQNDSVNEERGGASFATEWAYPHWECSMSTTNLTIDGERYLDWRSFIDSLRGKKKSGLFRDPRKPYPTAYRKTGFAGLVIAGTSSQFNGVAAIESFEARTRININGLPANFKLTRTDYVSFVLNDVSSLHRILRDVTASAAGNAQIVVEPRVPLAYTAASMVLFERPGFTGIIDSVRENSNVESTTISFQAKSLVGWGGGNIIGTEGWVLENGAWHDGGSWQTSGDW